MKKGIKIISVLLMAFIVIASPLVASASAGINANGARILAALEDEPNVAAQYVNQARNWLMRPEVNPTAAQADAVIGYIDEASKLVESASGGFGQWSTSLQNEVIGLVHRAASILNLTLHIDTVTGVVTILENPGIPGVPGTPGGNNVVGQSRPIIRDTGLNLAMSVGTLAILVASSIGSTVWAAAKKKSYEI